jgi:hypothetical protein
MKTLKITKPEQFELLYESAITRAKGYGLQESRTIGKILSLFEGMGKVKEEKNGIQLYTPISLPMQIELEDAPFQLLHVVFSETVWTGSGARKAADIADWLDEVARG